MLAVALGAVAVTSVAIPASGAESGLAAMHAMRHEGGRLCMSDHWHYGSSGSQATKAGAGISATNAAVLRRQAGQADGSLNAESRLASPMLSWPASAAEE